MGKKKRKGKMEEEKGEGGRDGPSLMLRSLTITVSVIHMQCVTMTPVSSRWMPLWKGKPLVLVVLVGAAGTGRGAEPGVSPIVCVPKRMHALLLGQKGVEWPLMGKDGSI